MLSPFHVFRAILVSTGPAPVRPSPYYGQVVSFHCEERLTVARKLIAETPSVVLAGLIHCGSYLLAAQKFRSQYEYGQFMVAALIAARKVNAIDSN